MKIEYFRGVFNYLSNFYDCPVIYEGLQYRNAESAFQAMKTLREDIRQDFINLSGSSAKALGKRVLLRSDWDIIKNDIMYEIVYAKFKQNKELKDKLLSTNTAILIEGNSWRDSYWGKYNNKGKNNLGLILMTVRYVLKMEDS